METSSTKYPKAYSEHKCDWCAQKIEKGEIYERTSVFDSGSIYSWKNHRRCAELTKKLDMFRDTYGDGLSREDFRQHVIEYFELKTNTNSRNLPFSEVIKTVFEITGIVVPPVKMRKYDKILTTRKYLEIGAKLVKWILDGNENSDSVDICFTDQQLNDFIRIQPEYLEMQKINNSDRNRYLMRAGIKRMLKKHNLRYNGTVYKVSKSIIAA